ncbi:MAG: hypothetical protein JNK21_15820 [Rhodospirillaceae bacterium]|nr:hypothetical protein [Rhodospirillaceae bacterium]
MAFIGTSFTVGGGQNPAEPAQLSRACLWGRDMSNFTELAAALEAEGAALKVAAPESLGAEVSALLSDPARAQAMGEAGARVIAANSQALEQTLACLAPYLDRLQIR